MNDKKPTDTKFDKDTNDTVLREKPETTPNTNVRGLRHNKPFVISAIATGLFAVLLVVMTLSMMHRGDGSMRGSTGQSATMQRGEMGGSGMPHSNDRQGMRDRTGSNSSASRTNGVVLSVNGNSFVLGGNGKQITVTTNDATTYNGTTKSVAVNDSVTVSGDVANNAVTATEVAVRNMTIQ